MSEGSVYRRKDGRWCAKWKDARGKWRYRYRKSRGEAKQTLREALQDRDDNIVPADRICYIPHTNSSNHLTCTPHPVYLLNPKSAYRTHHPYQAPLPTRDSKDPRPTPPLAPLMGRDETMRLCC